MNCSTTVQASTSIYILHKRYKVGYVIPNCPLLAAFTLYGDNGHFVYGLAASGVSELVLQSIDFGLQSLQFSLYFLGAGVGLPYFMENGQVLIWPHI